MATETQLVFLKFPLKAQPKRPVLPFIYEFSAIRSHKKPGSFVFECVLKVAKSDAVRAHKKHYPRLLSFYDLLENDAEVGSPVPLRRPRRRRREEAAREDPRRLRARRARNFRAPRRAQLGRRRGRPPLAPDARPTRGELTRSSTRSARPSSRSTPRRPR